jgi:Pyruvate/2-oxoacid:ferredoxin oxidoreductase delta subunit
MNKMSLPDLFPADSPYRQLARSLDALPNRFPPAEDQSDLRLLAYLFTPEEAGLAASLLPELESAASISQRLGRDLRATTLLLREMSKKGLIAIGKTPDGRLGFGILPFVVGFYEAQSGRMTVELARLFEDYYWKGFGKTLNIQPQNHRVIPVGESIRNDMEVSPFESVTDLVDQAKSWGVHECICRAQKALIGQACGHPIDSCMVLSDQVDAFKSDSVIRSLTREEAHATLQQAAQLGLVHCVSNNQRDLTYICNCCTCSCGILRGMVELGIANVVARSAFVNRVSEDRCIGCETCQSACSFEALSMKDGHAWVDEMRCVGCGVCVPSCPQDALWLDRRPDAAQPPTDEDDWRMARSKSQ